jgi:hypothetical protein
MGILFIEPSRTDRLPQDHTNDQIIISSHSPKINSSQHSENSSSAIDPISDRLNANFSLDLNMVVYDSLNLGLNFSHGTNFAKDVKSKFNFAIHPSAKTGHFVMVVSFGRSTFKLSEDVVSLALEAIIGGYCGEIKVSLWRDKVYFFVCPIS